MRVSWCLVLGCVVASAGCRLVAGYEDMTLNPLGSGGGAGIGGGASGGGGTGGVGGGSGPVVTITSLTATPDTVVGSRQVTIEWEVENADSCEFDEGLGTAAPYFGTIDVTPTTTTTYTLTCQGLGGPATEDVTAAVLGVSLHGGSGFTCARAFNNVFKCFGDNASGQLGQGDTDERGDAAGEMGDALLSIDVGQDHTVLGAGLGDHHVCVLLDDNNVRCWGQNGSGQLGLDDTEDRGDGSGEMGNGLPWVTVGGAVSFALGSAHSCALLLNDTVKCWGENSSGQLGLGDTNDRGDTTGEMGILVAVDLGSPRTATAIAAGSAHSCALLDDQSVKCWGDNQYGQLGKEHQNNLGDGSNEMGAALLPIQLGAPATAIGARGDHTCALLDSSQVKCWGRNDRGQLGTGDNVNHGAGPNTMGSNLITVPLGTGRSVQNIAVGGAHSCALTDIDQIKCWGANDQGQLGQGDTNDRGSDLTELGGFLDHIDFGGQTVTAIAAGSNHTCVVLDDGTVRCWGDNDSGELGLGDVFDRGSGAGEMGDNLSLVDLTP